MSAADLSEIRTPAEIGRSLAERMRDLPTPRFLAALDDVLDDLPDELVVAGKAAPAAFLICREARLAAREAWHAPAGQ